MNLNTGGWASRAALSIVTRLFSTGTNATRPVVAVLPPEDRETILRTNLDVALVAKGFGATIAQVPDETTTGGNLRGQRSTDFQKNRGTAAQVASGTTSGILAGVSNQASGVSSVVVGGDSNTASSNYSFVGGGGSNIAQTGTYSAVCGGGANTASGQYAFVGAGSNNTASALRSVIAGGDTNTASSSRSFVGGGQSNIASTGTHATVCGGSTNTASGQYSFVGGGYTNTASGSNSFIGNGDTNTASGLVSVIGGGFFNEATGEGAVIAGGNRNVASGLYSFIGGGYRGSTRGLRGYHVFPACVVPIADVAGVSQSGLLVLGRQTTDATTTVLASNSSAASTTNQVILPNNSAYSFSGEVIANVTGAGNSARWTIDGAIKRGANAASTVMIGTPTVVMSHFDAGAATWVVALTADTTNGGIAVTVTGAAATTIRWVCKINTTEMTY